jgi:hypothetical protein
MLENVPSGSYRMVVTLTGSGIDKRSARSEQVIMVNDNMLTEADVFLDVPAVSPGP